MLIGIGKIFQKNNQSHLLQYFFLASSLFIVLFSQPDWSPFCCILASALGYALFWKAMLYCPKKRQRFGLALVWFAGVQTVHLNWFMADRYVGIYIYIFILILVVGLGLGFAFLSLAIKPADQLTLWRLLGISGAWTLFEWGRLFFLSGFSWNPVRLALTATMESLQFASAFGLFGLTFWVIMTNLFALKCLKIPVYFGPVAVWIVFAIAPFLYGFGQLSFHKKQMEKLQYPTISTLLIQTALYPEEKVPLSGISTATYSPLEQWKRILTLLKPHLKKEIDLIAFSESVVPYGTDVPIFTIEQVSKAFEEILGIRFSYSESPHTPVGNAYWILALANTFCSDIVIGLEDLEEGPEEASLAAYNAAFFFTPRTWKRQRYEKRVLVPMGEYIPFNWCKKMLAQYGIQDSFTPGKAAKIFPGHKASIGVSICYEETYGHLMRENRLKGAGLLVNLTNDVWYPRSRLPLVHYFHGRVRAVEMGIPVVRATNTGVTCAIDSLGRTVGWLDYENETSSPAAGVLHATVSTYNYPTLYTRYGDSLIIWISLLSVFVGIASLFRSSQEISFEKI